MPIAYANATIGYMSEELISEYDIRGTKETGLTVECAWNVGKALADWLSEAGEVAVSYPSSQEEIAKGVIEGLRLQGRHVIDAGSNDKGFVTSYIVTGGLAGAAIVDFIEPEKVITIELYSQGAKRIDSEHGLYEIRQLVEAGNFVPAAMKGDLTKIMT